MNSANEAPMTVILRMKGSDLQALHERKVSRGTRAETRRSEALLTQGFRAGSRALRARSPKPDPVSN